MNGCTSEKEASEFDSSCTVDSDCVIKTNNMNCPIAVNAKEKASYKQSIPPSHTECPETNEIIARCIESDCKVRYDCSQCPTLKSKMDFCTTYSGGTMSWICDLYKECKC